jgi:uncharacterized OB-fold protein
VNREAQQLWAAWQDGRLCLQICSTCGHAQHPPGPVCSTCHGTSLTLHEISGEAELLAWSTVCRAPSIAFADQVPYTLVLVRVPEGALVEARTEVAPSDTEGWTAGQPASLLLGELNGTVLPVARVGH